jgi:hypothetical protein
VTTEPVPAGRLILATLATWRVTHLLVNEDGPGDVVVRLRRRAGSGWAGALMDCFYCMSFWVAVAVVSMMTRSRRPAPVLWLAVSGGACLLEQATRGDTRKEDRDSDIEEIRYQ